MNWAHQFVQLRMRHVFPNHAFRRWQFIAILHVIERYFQAAQRFTCHYYTLIIKSEFVVDQEMGNCQGNNAINQTIQPMSFQGIQLICKSWKKTYSNLFDYTAAPDSLQMHFIKIDKSIRIFKGDGGYQQAEYENIEKSKQIQAGIKELQAIIDILQVKDRESQNQAEKTFLQRYRLIGRNQKSRNQLWIVVKSLSSKKYTLKQGDVIKVGKQKIRVKEIITKTQDQKEEDDSINTKYKIYDSLTKQSKGLDIPQNQIHNHICRICLQEGENSNPLIVTCNCSGSAKYIHLKCIQQWLTKSINPHPVNMSTVITWKPLICQLCSKAIPFKIYLDGKKHFTVNIPRPEKPYLVLNPIFKEKEEKQKSKIYFLVSFSKKKEMIIGRKKDSDILVSQDSSVSRHHSLIKFELSSGKESGKFTLQDNESKFGTLVMLKREVQLKQQLNGISFQLGGDVIEMKMGFKTLKNEAFIPEGDLINKSQSDSSQDYEQEQEQNENGNEENKPQGEREMFQ